MTDTKPFNDKQTIEEQKVYLQIKGVHMQIDGDKIFLHFHDDFVLETRVGWFYICPIIETIPLSKIRESKDLK